MAWGYDIQDASGKGIDEAEFEGLDQLSDQDRKQFDAARKAAKQIVGAMRSARGKRRRLFVHIAGHSNDKDPHDGPAPDTVTVTVTHIEDAEPEPDFEPEQPED